MSQIFRTLFIGVLLLILGALFTTNRAEASHTGRDFECVEQSHTDSACTLPPEKGSTFFCLSTDNTDLECKERDPLINPGVFSFISCRSCSDVGRVCDDNNGVNSTFKCVFSTATPTPTKAPTPTPPPAATPTPTPPCGALNQDCCGLLRICNAGLVCDPISDFCVAPTPAPTATPAPPTPTPPPGATPTPTPVVPISTPFPLTPTPTTTPTPTPTPIPDTTKPNVSVSHSPSSPKESCSVTVTATADDPESGIKQVDVVVDLDGNGNFDAGEFFRCSSSPCAWNLPPLPAGKYKYYATATSNNPDPNNATTSLTPSEFTVTATKGTLQCTQATGCKCTKIATAIGEIDVDPAKFVSRIMSLLLGLAGGIAVLLIIAAGYSLIVSRDNPQAVNDARERILAAIVGLLFVIFALVILEVIGVDILQIPGFG